MKCHALTGDKIFYDIYTDEEKAADPSKEDTGLFFFKGEPGARFAICNAGGMVFVSAMHDSFPHALELSKMGYNAFALIYRPGGQTACEDLARAIAFVYVESEVFDGLPHGFGLGTGTVAEGWIENAVAFWERQMDR